MDAFKYVRGLIDKATDADHEIYMAGQPVLTGWVYQYESQMIGIFAVTLGCALILALALYMGNIVGVVTPIVTSAVAAIWGFGFVGWLHSPIEPLIPGSTLYLSDAWAAGDPLLTSGNYRGADAPRRRVTGNQL